MKENFKKYSIQFIKEIIPVIAGILIALFIENWNSERKDKAYIDQVFVTVDKELKDSKDNIITTIPRQQKLMDTLQYYADRKDVNILNIVIKAGGFYSPQLKTNAWKTASTTKIDLVDYKKINSLSKIEEIKDILKEKNDFLMSYAYNNINSTEKNTKITFKMILNDIIQNENTALKVIEDYEKH